MALSFEKVTLTISSLIVVGSLAGLYMVAQMPETEGVPNDREIVGSIAALDNNVKRKIYGNFSWDIVAGGDPVYYKDVIFVSPQSSLKLTLSDNTELNLGENTMLVLDNKMTSEENNRFAVTELRLIRGNISVKQPENAPTDTTAKPIQIVLDQKVRLNLKEKSNVTLAKSNNKASILLGNGKVSMSVTDKARGSKQVALNYTKPTLIKELELVSGSSPESADDLKTEEVDESTAEKIRAAHLKPKSGRALLKAVESTPVVIQGDLTRLDDVLPERKFAPKNKVAAIYGAGSGADKLNPTTSPDAGADPGAAPLASPSAEASPSPSPAALAQVTPSPSPSPRPQVLSVVSKKKLIVAAKKIEPPVSPQLPAESTVLDATRELHPIGFTWTSSVEGVKFYMLEFSSEKTFSGVLTRIAIDASESKGVKDRRKQYELKVSPVYMLYVPGLMASVYRTRSFFWRVVPQDTAGESMLKVETIPIRELKFKVSAAADLTAPTNSFYGSAEASGSNPNLNLKFTLKNVVPGSYQIHFSDKPDFKRTICKRDIEKFAFKKGFKIKQQPLTNKAAEKFPLRFEEELKINTIADCPLAPLLKNQKTIYYQIIAQDPSERQIAYVSQTMGRGRFSFKKN